MSKFFGFMDPTREGKGVSKDAPQKKRFFLFFELYLRKLSKIILINIIYVLTCLPIVTIGPATAAMTYCMRNFAREEHADLSDYFDQFKKNFWQSLAVSIIMLVSEIIIVFGIIFYYFKMVDGSAFSFIGFVVSVMTAFIFVSMSYYIYMMLVTFKLKIRQLIKNAFIFAFAGIKTNFITTFFMVIIYGWFFVYGIYPVILPLYKPDAPVYLSAVCLALGLYLFFIPSLASFIVNFNVYPHVKKYMIDPAMKEKEEQERKQAIFNDDIIE